MCQILLQFLDSTSQYIYCVLFILGGLVACIENTLVLLIINKPIHRANKSHIFYASLAVSDMLVGYVAFPLHAIQSMVGQHQNMCAVDEARRFFLVTLVGSSSLAVGFIAYDRYTRITKLNNYNQSMTKRKVYVLIALTWFIPILFTNVKYVNMKLYWASLVFIIAIPLVMLMICHYVIIRVMRRSIRDVSAHVKGNQQPSSVGYVVKMQSENQERKVTRKVTTLIMCYIASNLPCAAWFCFTILMLTLRLNVLSSQISMHWYTLSTLISLFNSCINPIVYIAMDPKLKKTFLKTFTSVDKRKQRVNPSLIKLTNY